MSPWDREVHDWAAPPRDELREALDGIRLVEVVREVFRGVDLTHARRALIELDELARAGAPSPRSIDSPPHRVIEAVQGDSRELNQPGRTRTHRA